MRVYGSSQLLGSAVFWIPTHGYKSVLRLKLNLSPEFLLKEIHHTIGSLRVTPLKYGMTGKTWHDYEREGFVEVQSLKWKDIFIYLKRDTVQAEISCFHDYGQELAVSLLCCLEILRNRRQK